ncbi:hypothetical protein HZ326_30024 [Fusarium oxysporum f. sp. albedinis]|nr:hypothetical protein HZ326_30024 [Fusarium oxysporum f. sp. albedinis]
MIWFSARSSSCAVFCFHERIVPNPPQTAAFSHVNSRTRFSAAWRWLTILKRSRNWEAIESSTPFVLSVVDLFMLTVLLTVSPMSTRRHQEKRGWNSGWSSCCCLRRSWSRTFIKTPANLLGRTEPQA